MWLEQLRRRWLGRTRSARRAQARRRASVVLAVDVLEARTLPSTLTVTTLKDTTGAGSLRGAIIAANADAGTDTDTIVLGKGVYKLTLKNTGTQENAAASGDLDVTSTSHTLIIEGKGTTGKNKTTIDATQLKDRILQITDPATTVELHNLIIKGGMAQDDGTADAKPGDTDALGGGILNTGTLVLKNVVIQGNKAVATNGHAAQGGGIFSQNGTLTIERGKSAPSTIKSNQALGAGGGATGTGTADTTAVGNGGDAQGGGLFASGGTVNLTGVLITGNTARAGGGGNAPNAKPTPSGLSTIAGDGGSGGNGQGGGLFADGSTVTIIASTVSSNTAQGGAGGRGGSSKGGGGAGGAAGNAQGGGAFATGGDFTLTNSTIAANSARAGDGGKGGNGPATRPKPPGTMMAAGGDSQGGGLFAAGGSLTLAASAGVQSSTSPAAATGTAPTTPTTPTTSAAGGGNGGIGGNGQGGGLYAADGSVTLVSATIAANTTKNGAGGPRGGGFKPGQAGADGTGEGGGVFNQSSLDASNTLIAKNTAATAPDFSGSVSTSSHNLIGDGTGSTGFDSATGDLVGSASNRINPMLGPLRNNGGGIPTMALLRKSPAIDKGDNNASPGDTDERGAARVNKGTIDIGAVEFK